MISFKRWKVSEILDSHFYFLFMELTSDMLQKIVDLVYHTILALGKMVQIKLTKSRKEFVGPPKYEREKTLVPLLSPIPLLFMCGSIIFYRFFLTNSFSLVWLGWVGLETVFGVFGFVFWFCSPNDKYGIKFVLSLCFWLLFVSFYTKLIRAKKKEEYLSYCAGKGEERERGILSDFFLLTFNPWV